jgi:3-dehydroquinate dehydratase / shikimate dehydrogenase
LSDESERRSLLRWISSLRKKPVLIATCRTLQGGGQFEGTREEELAVLGEAARAGCRWCDLEIEAAEHFSAPTLRKAVAPAKLLISAHDFAGMPENVPALIARLKRCGAHAVKIAATCNSLADVGRLLMPARKGGLVAIPMGQSAEAARILALREGSELAYASVHDTVAPGQLTLQAMRTDYRLARRFGRSRRLTSRTQVYGVIGDPIGHSLSPLMHNAGFAALGMDAVYLPFLVKGLDDFVEAVRRFRFAGFSVTLPHKETILKYLDGCDPLAAEIGAVNTVQVRGKGRLYGYNTDYTGVLQSIEQHMPLAGSRVVLIGAGGSARAAAFALARRQAKVFVWARRQEQAAALAQAVGGQAIERGALRMERFDALVNCTPVGMYPRGGSPLDPRELNARIVMDLIYRPMKTELLQQAERKGIAVISGVEMFLAQGAAQWEAWMGRRAPTTVMRRAVIAALATGEQAAGSKS